MFKNYHTLNQFNLFLGDKVKPNYINNQFLYFVDTYPTTKTSYVMYGVYRKKYVFQVFDLDYPLTQETS